MTEEEWQAKALAIKARDGWSCAICGWEPASIAERRFLHVHHICPRSTHPELRLCDSNLITLCWHHHCMVSDDYALDLLMQRKPPFAVRQEMRRLAIVPAESEDRMRWYMATIAQS